MSQLISSCEFNLSSEPFLLEEERNTPSNLNIADQMFIDLNNLFCLDIVGNIAILIQPPIEIAGASLFHRSSRNQYIVNFGALEENFKETDKTLDHWCDPARNMCNIFEK